MKAIHILMVVLVYVIQISMGSKVTLGDFTIDVGSAQSVNLCGDNEEFQANADLTFSCPCIPNAYRHNETRRCTLTYRWIEFTNNLVGDARFVKTGKVGSNLFVIARAVYDNGDKIPYEGIIDIYTKTIKFSFEPDEAIIDIEALMIESGKVMWVSPPLGTTRKDAVEGGTMNHEPIYLCRTMIGQIHHIGWSRPKGNACHFNGLGYPNLSLLVYKKYYD